MWLQADPPEKITNDGFAGGGGDMFMVRKANTGNVMKRERERERW